VKRERKRENTSKDRRTNIRIQYGGGKPLKKVSNQEVKKKGNLPARDREKEMALVRERERVAVPERS